MLATAEVLENNSAEGDRSAPQGAQNWGPSRSPFPNPTALLHNQAARSNPEYRSPPHPETRLASRPGGMAMGKE